MIKKWLKDSGEYTYFVFRVLVGFLFFFHGAQKFGWLGGQAVDLWSLFGLAGVIEVVGGTLLVVGLLTQWVAVITALEMVVAYIMMHTIFGNPLVVSWNPLVNQGELAVLYFVAFLVIAHHGSLKWSLDNLWFKH